MIGKLKGVVDEIGEDWALIDVNGVCYEVSCSSRTLSALKGVGESATLAIETYVREDQFKLFGFIDQQERTWFKLLQSVQGVGAKVALAIMSTLSMADLSAAIATQDKAMVARSPGVGPKVAGRIVSELKDKVPAFSGSTERQRAEASPETETVSNSATSDAISALTNLGYSPAQASGAVAAVYGDAGDDASTEKLIRLGLKELSK